MSRSSMGYNELKPQYEDPEPDGRIYRLVSFGNKRWCKIAILIFWAVFTLGGVVSMKSFMSSLKSSIPPVAGTDAKAAQDAMKQYYYEPNNQDEVPASVAMLVSRRDGKPLLNCTSQNSTEVLNSVDLDWLNMFTPANESETYKTICGGCAATCPITAQPPFFNTALLLDGLNDPEYQGSEAGVFELYQLLKPSLQTEDCTTSLTLVSLSGCDDDTYRDIAESLKKMAIPDSLKLEVTSQQLMTKNIQEGVNSTMDLSTLTLPLALLVLAGMLTNVRLVLCTVVNVMASVASSILLMFPIAKLVDVTSVAPSMMIAVALAMSIDYSLFLLSRFQAEAHLGAVRAVSIMLETSGRIVLVSGGTLLLCFMMMLVIPVQLISMMGVASAVTVFFTITVALTLTPTILLCCPDFFLANRRYGFTCDGCPCNNNQEHREEPIAKVDPEGLVSQVSEPSLIPEELPNTCWITLGNLTQRYAIPMLMILFSLAIPMMAVYLPKFKHALGEIPMMPRGTDSYNEVQRIQDLFGMTSVFPLSFAVVPSPGALKRWENSSGLWNYYMCGNLTKLAPGDTLASSMLVGPECLYSADGTVRPNFFVSQWLLSSMYISPSNADFSDIRAFKVQISTSLDIFADQGQDWVNRLRNNIDALTASEAGQHLLGSEGEIYMTGEAVNQLDNAKKAYSRFIPMVGLMMALVVLLLGFTFRSIVLPLRAVICLLWMLGMTFGIAIAVFQCGWFDGLKWDSVERRELGAMYWMSPLVSFSIIVGLGLDYDIFYTERVHEEKAKGFTDSEAAVRALAFTANTISAAGVIMIMAFSALLVSSTASMNEISLLLIVGILCDCFVTTKLIIPATIAVLDGYNFWPSMKELKQEGPPEGCKLLCEMTECCRK